MKSTRRVALSLSAVVLSAGLLTSLVGCSAGGSSSPTGSARASESAIPTVKPTFGAQGSASDNIAFFRSIVDAAVAKEGLNANTEALAKKLAVAGFDAKGIQFSDNSTAAGMTPDSVTVSAQFKDQCLIAQYGPSIKGVTVSVLPVLKSGGCLIGRSLNHL